MNQLYDPNNKLIHILEKNPRYRIFYQCLKRYNLLNQLVRPGVTLFIPTNTSFLTRLHELDTQGDIKIREILMAHIVPERLHYLHIGKKYNTILKNHGITLTGVRKIGDIMIEPNPKVFGNVVLYRVSDIIL